MTITLQAITPIIPGWRYLVSYQTEAGAEDQFVMDAWTEEEAIRYVSFDLDCMGYTVVDATQQQPPQPQAFAA